MQLNGKQLQILTAISEKDCSMSTYEYLCNKLIDLPESLIKYYLDDLNKQGYIEYYQLSKSPFIRLTSKGKVAVENPEDLTQPNSVIPMNNNTNNISISGSINSPINILQDADNNTVTINQNIDQNIAEVIKSLDFLQKEIQTFPENQKEIATVHLDDLREEITTEERRNPKKIKAYFMAFLGIALPLLGYVANTTDFINNLTDLGEKFNIEVPKLGEIIQESELMQEESVKLADEINQSAWQQLKPTTLK